MQRTRPPTARRVHSLAILFILLIVSPLLPTMDVTRAQTAASNLRFDGSNDLVRTVNLPLLTEFTIEAWIQRGADTGRYEAIVSDANSSYSQAMLTLFVDGGSADCGAGDQFAYYQISGNSLMCSGATAVAGVWYHVAVSRDATGTRRFFVNGELRATQSGTPAPTDSSGILTIGRAGDSAGEYFNGQIDELRISSAAVYTAAFAPPIEQLPVGSATIALYRFNEGTGQVVNDSSGNGRHGTLGTGSSADSSDPTWANGSPIGGGSSPTATATSVGTPTATSTFTPTPGVGTPTATPPPTATPQPNPTPTPPPGANQLGLWEGPFTWPVPAVHTNLTPDGRILFWDQANGGLGAQYWDPETNTFWEVPNTQTNLFCVGQTTFADGRIFAVGGHRNQNFYGLPDANIYDYVQRRWTRVANMRWDRWYPTLTTLPDGRILAISGYITPGDLAEIPEIYNPTTNTWTELPGAALNVPMYPFMFVLPDGRVFEAGPSTTTRILDINAQRWTTVGNSFISGHSAVMYAPGRVMKSGQYGNPDDPAPTVNNRTVVVDLTQPSPAWREVASMARPRSYHTLTMLPDGTVLVTGGSRSTIGNIVNDAVYETELWNPQTEQWTTLASQRRPRMYHSTALLLPDGRVLSAGGEFPPYYEANAEIFSPPYLFRGPRPTVTSAPASIGYGSSFFVGTPDAATIASASLIRLPAVTHGIDMSQRFIPLTLSQASGGLNLQSPANANIAPPGYYMLFLVSGAGVPSIARFVQVSSTAGGATSTPTLTGTATSAPTSTSTSISTMTPTGTATSAPTGTATSISTMTPTGTATSAPTSTMTPAGGNYALAFDGSNDYLRGPLIAGTGSAQTIEVWVRPSANNANAIIASHADGSRGWSLELANGRALFWVADTSGRWRSARNTAVTLRSGQWYHIAATYNNGSARVYVNGTQGSATNVGTLSQGPALQIGGLSGFPFFAGQIDELRLSSGIRYSAGFTPPARFVPDASTLALYHLDEASGQTSADQSGNGYHLTLGSGSGSDSADPGWVVSSAPTN